MKTTIAILGLSLLGIVQAREPIMKVVISGQNLHLTGFCGNTITVTGANVTYSVTTQ